jgi:hypothetical protein
MAALRRKQLDHMIDTIQRRQTAPATAMAGLAAWLAPALFPLAAALSLLTGQSIGRGRLGGSRRVLSPQTQLSFEFGDLFLGIGDFLVALDQFLPQFFILAAQAVVFTLEVLRSYQLPSARLAMRWPQTYTLPGFSTNSQVQITDFKDFRDVTFAANGFRHVNCYMFPLW